MRNKLGNWRNVLLLNLAFCALTANGADSTGPKIPRWMPHDFAFSARATVTNPFTVRFSAHVTGPRGQSFDQPGFYDGSGTWKVRISASGEGEWSLLTTSELPELNTRMASFTCVPNPNRNVHGGLRVDAAHPHHFVFEDGTRFFLLGYECDWLWALDMGQRKLNKTGPFLDLLANHGFDYVIVNSYAYDHPQRHPGRTGPDDFGPPPLCAWEGTNDHPDHSRLNLAYWQDFDRMMQALCERGMICHLMTKVYNKKVHWPAPGSAEDDLFFRWLVSRYAAYPNIVWDFAKEAQREKNLPYKLDRLRFLRANDPYHRLVTVNDDDVNNDAGAYDELTDFRADQQHSKFRQKILAQHQRRAWPVANIEYGYEQGGTDTEEQRIAAKAQPAEELVRRAWEIAMAGGYPGYYYVYTAWDIIRPNDLPKGYAYFKQLRDFFESTRYWELAPVENVASDGWVLGNPGREYVVCLPQAKSFSFTSDISGVSDAKWFQPLTNQRADGGRIKFGSQEIAPPPGWEGRMAVLHIKPL